MSFGPLQLSADPYMANKDYLSSAGRCRTDSGSLSALSHLYICKITYTHFLYLAQSIYKCTSVAPVLTLHSEHNPSTRKEN